MIRSAWLLEIGPRAAGQLQQAGAQPGQWWPSLLIGGLVAIALWTKIVWTLYSASGLFRLIGADWAYFAAQAGALRAGEVASLYDLAVLAEYLRPFAAYTSDPARPIIAGPVSYPPLFAWLLGPFTLVPPPVGFALWTGLTLLIALHLARRVAELFSPKARSWVAVVVLASFPVMRDLISGQVTILMAAAVAESYLAFRAGRELRAGLWLAVLVLKPQLLLVIGPVLLLKRRWAALSGIAAGAGVVVAGSFLAAGGDALLRYPLAIVEQGGFRGHATTAPEVMVNWRALILLVAPEISDRRGLSLAVLLGGLTVLWLLPIWRGRWAPQDRLFPAKISLTLIATLLAGYHVHAPYTLFLALPLAAAFRQSSSPLTRTAIVATAVLPTVTGLAAAVLPPIAYAGRTWLGAALPFPPLFPLLLLACYVSLLVEVLSAGSDRGRSSARQGAGSVVAAEPASRSPSPAALA